MPVKAGHKSYLHPRERADGSAVLDVRFRVDGRSKSVTFLDVASAKRFQSVIEKVGGRNALAFLQSDSLETPTLNEFAERFIRSKSGVEGKTTDDYKRFMRTSIGPAFGDLPMNAVTRELVAQWINDMAAAGLAHKTIKNRHSFLSSMFKRAIEDDVPGVRKNPAHGARLPQTVSQQEMTFLEPWEFNQLLEYIPEQYYELVLTLAATGMRWGEATALQPADFDFTQGTVRVVKAWKKSSERGYYIGPPKTRRSRRTISLPPRMVPVLEQLIARTRSEFVFQNRAGGPVRQATFWEKAWAPARNLANGRPAFDESNPRYLNGYIPRAGGTWDREPAQRPIHKEPRVHDLRHSHVSWLLAAGAGLDVIQARLGHESITTTVDRYGHIASDRMFAAAKLVDHVFEPSVGALVTLAPSLALTDAEAGAWEPDPNDVD